MFRDELICVQSYVVINGHIKFEVDTFKKPILYVFNKIDVSLRVCTLQIEDRHSRINLFNSQYRSLDYLKTFNSDEWCIIKPNMFDDCFITHPKLSREFKLLVKVMPRPVNDKTVLSWT